MLELTKRKGGFKVDKMRCVKMDTIMKNMFVYALREVFRKEKADGHPVDATRELLLKIADQDEGKLYLTEREHKKILESLNLLRDIYIHNGRYTDGIDGVFLKVLRAKYRRGGVR